MRPRPSPKTQSLNRPDVCFYAIRLGVRQMKFLWYQYLALVSGLPDRGVAHSCTCSLASPHHPPVRARLWMENIVGMFLASFLFLPLLPFLLLYFCVHKHLHLYMRINIYIYIYIHSSHVVWSLLCAGACSCPCTSGGGREYFFVTCVLQGQNIVTYIFSGVHVYLRVLVCIHS